MFQMDYGTCHKIINTSRRLWDGLNLPTYHIEREKKNEKIHTVIKTTGLSEGWMQWFWD